MLESKRSINKKFLGRAYLVIDKPLISWHAVSDQSVTCHIDFYCVVPLHKGTSSGWHDVTRLHSSFVYSLWQFWIARRPMSCSSKPQQMLVYLELALNVFYLALDTTHWIWVAFDDFPIRLSMRTGLFATTQYAFLPNISPTVFCASFVISFLPNGFSSRKSFRQPALSWLPSSDQLAVK